MKANIIILAVFLTLSTALFSQTEGEIVKLKTDIKTIDATTLIKGVQKPDVNYLESGIKFRIVEIGKDSVKIRALDFQPLKEKTLEDLVKTNPDYVDKSKLYNDRIFTVRTSDILANAEKVEPVDKISLGLLTLPFKARPVGDFSFDTEFNLNSTLSYNLSATKSNHFHLQVGAGIGTVGLNTSNAEGMAENEAQDVSTLTFLGGIMLEHNKIQAGIYCGFDYINNQKNYCWDSNGDIWIGFGIGYDIFKISLSKTETQ